MCEKSKHRISCEAMAERIVELLVDMDALVEADGFREAADRETIVNEIATFLENNT